MFARSRPETPATRFPPATFGNEPSNTAIAFPFIYVFTALSVVPCSADDELLRRCVQSWQEYENIQLRGTAERHDLSGLQESLPFTLSVGSGVDGRAAPLEIGLRIPNPGEPHIDDAEIFKEAIAHTSELWAYFERELISEPPYGDQLSYIRLQPFPGRAPFNKIELAFFGGLDGSSPRLAMKDMAKIMKNCTLEVLGDEKYLGFDVKRVLLAIDVGADASGQTFPPLKIESLIAPEPTLQILRNVSAEGGPEWLLERESAENSYLGREVLSAKVFDRWLICDQVKLPASEQDSHWLIRFDELQPLPDDYVGLWDYDRMTGVAFIGTLEQATRKGTPRIEMEHTKEASYIPYTQEEQEKIRQFLIGKTAPIKPSVAWSTILFWAANVVAVVVLSYVGYRRLRYG